MFVAGPNLSNHPCMYSSNMALWEKCIMCFSSLVWSDVFLSVFILPVLTCLSALAVFSVHSNLWLSPRSVLQVENAVCVSVSFPESLSNLSQADTSHQSWGPHLLNVSLSLSLSHTHTHTHTHMRVLGPVSWQACTFFSPFITVATLNIICVYLMVQRNINVIREMSFHLSICLSSRLINRLGSRLFFQNFQTRLCQYYLLHWNLNCYCASCLLCYHHSKCTLVATLSPMYPIHAINKTRTRSVLPNI